ncbi:uncharacterized protein PRCAT00005691001 [Priceomyces carsonii]|uniref:uncharacterized protein n=1 Tax=Priceomyces carsonii TaxID=28549 RepID=UPI002ED77D3A|nr:unnamed protein product [Priceomyces carsonii]
MGLFKLKIWLPLAIITYFMYTLTVVCPISKEANILPAEGVYYYTCSFSNNYIRPIFLSTIDPVLQEKVHPFFENNVRPVFEEIDDKINFQRNYHLLVRQVKKVESSYKVRSKFNDLLKVLQAKSINLFYFIKASTSPTLMDWSDKIALGIQKLYRMISTLVHLRVAPAQSKISELFSWVFEKLNVSYYWSMVKDAYKILLEKSNKINLQERTKFIRNELKNVMHFNEVKHATTQQSENIVDVVKDIINEFSEDESEDLTIKVTSTVTVTREPSSLTSLPDQVDQSKVKIDAELDRWGQKVQKTLSLAARNLQLDMDPAVEEVINSIKSQISEKLQNIQAENFKSYKELDKMIREINRDFEKVKSSEQISESVTRQEVRDIFTQAYQTDENIVNGIREIINQSHKGILTKYFDVVQDTIDILESFAERTVLEYSNRLSNIIEELEKSSPHYDDELTWNGWKRFHKIKEEFFHARDMYYNQASDYKDNSALIPSGLEKWDEYLKKVEFHISALLREHDDYLKIMRAKANVAFQLRESAVSDLQKRVNQTNPAENTKSHSWGSDVELDGSDRLEDDATLDSNISDLSDIDDVGDTVDE